MAKASMAQAMVLALDGDTIPYTEAANGNWLAMATAVASAVFTQVLQATAASVAALRDQREWASCRLRYQEPVVVALVVQASKAYLDASDALTTSVQTARRLRLV